MKKLITLIAIATSFVIYAQAPQSFAYQGIARNNTGAPINNQLISIRASILDASSTGTVQYQETQSVTTNSLGLFSIAIGNGTVAVGTFSTITWANNLKYLKVEFDPAGGSSYVLSGTQQILSVPYALNALNAKTYTAGSGIAVNNTTITNTAPNQTVAITGTGHTSVTGTYPTYTVNTPVYTASTGISITGNSITNTAPNQTVNLTGAGSTSVTGSYPNYTVNTNLSPCMPKYITNANLVNLTASNNSSLAYNTLNCAAYIPVGATHVILNVVANSSYFYINFRKDAISQSIYTNSGNSNAIGMIIVAGLTYANSQVTIPVDALRSFQYLYTNNGLASTGDIKIDIIGYY